MKSGKLGVFLSGKQINVCPRTTDKLHFNIQSGWKFSKVEFLSCYFPPGNLKWKETCSLKDKSPTSTVYEALHSLNPACFLLVRPRSFPPPIFDLQQYQSMRIVGRCGTGSGVPLHVWCSLLIIPFLWAFFLSLLSLSRLSHFTLLPLCLVCGGEGEMLEQTLFPGELLSGLFWVGEKWDKKLERS